MASTRQIQLRRRAVSNICKVTRTMEMISTSRYRGYFEKWSKSEQFYDTLAQMAYLLVTAEQQIDHPLMEENDSGNIAVLVMGANRGLCGGFSSAINNLIEVHIKRAKRLKKNIRFFASGKKVVNYMRSRGVKIEKVFDDFDEVPSTDRANEIADEFIDMYQKKTIDYLGIVHTRFFNMASQHAQTLTLLPIPDLIDDLTTRAKVIWPWEKNFEDFSFTPDADRIFETLARMMVRSSVASCFMESALSEHLARVVAMKNATDNAQTMMDDLASEYNRARQTQITGELMDIVGGVEALQK